MKVEVDTRRDSKEEIKHAIKLLMAAANMKNKEIFSNEPEENNSANDLINLFGDEPKKEESSSNQNNGGYVNLFAPNEETSPPVEETEQAQESGNPLANFFGASNSNDGEPDGQTDPDDDNDESGFFKAYEDEEDKEKKHRISFY